MAVSRAALVERGIQRSGVDGGAEYLIEGWCTGDSITAVSRVETAWVRREELLPALASHPHLARLGIVAVHEQRIATWIMPLRQWIIAH